MLSTRYNLSKGMVVKDHNQRLRLQKSGKRGELHFILGKNIDRYCIRYEYFTTYEELEIVGGTKVLAKHLVVPRVLIRQTGDSVCATYSNNPELIESTLYIMTGGSEKELMSSLAILNSRLMTYYARQSFVTNQQAFPQIVMSNLQQLPIPVLSVNKRSNAPSFRIESYEQKNAIGRQIRWRWSRRLTGWYMSCTV